MKIIIAVIVFSVMLAGVITAIPKPSKSREDLLPVATRERLIGAYAKILSGTPHPAQTTQTLAIDMPLEDLREAYRRAGQPVPEGLASIEKDTWEREHRQ